MSKKTDTTKDQQPARKAYYKTLDKVRTPSVMLNAILGGGVPFGRMVNSFGKLQSGKTTFALQTAQYFLEDYPDSRVVIIDSEANYSDASRLENVFGLAPHNGEVECINPDERVFLHFEATIEGAFNLAIKYCNESRDQNLPTLIILDSLSTLVPSRDIEELEKALDKGGLENSFAGGMMAGPRILAQKTSHLLGALPSSLAVVFSISQATIDLENSNAFNGVVIKAKNSGYALGHAFHLQLSFTTLPSSLKANPNEKSDAFKANKNYVEQGGALQDDDNLRKTTLTTLSITKNKISVAESNIVLMINNVTGGRFVERWEALESISALKGILVSNGGRFSLRDDLKEKYKDRKLIYNDINKETGEATPKEKSLDVTWLKQEIVNSDEFFQLLKDEIVNYYRENISAVDSIYAQMDAFRAAKGL